MIRRLLPHPVLSLALVAVWLLLSDGFGRGTLLLALIVGLALPLLVAPYLRGGARLRRPWRVPAYLAVLGWDILRANFTVARIVLFMPRRDLRPAWLRVPLDLHQPEAITALAATITLTPGTLSCDLSRDGRALLVHCLHAPDPQAVLAEIKTRYESRLQEIFG
ncbi:Na+/H+ antiporter subunit E [Paracoccus limosus]|jgi:multicomponent K+:H+ antiporter subunit E|uniref:Na+/H+ antiporter subunit E n=1 Tax=Paracoccus limosus TaxID=913252 RepID=A0A844HAP8_9RHOB|nr:Na+/H+ antiporter subunit E [Paracoccus limosus]MTH35838.1 Na+/H+ antiporter subunit E [Paracoccus limosus]